LKLTDCGNEDRRMSTDGKRFDDLLGALALLIGAMDRAALMGLRARLAACTGDAASRETVLEIIDGQLALRDLLGK
jgi:hypothetical protein